MPLTWYWAAGTETWLSPEGAVGAGLLGEDVYDAASALAGYITGPKDLFGDDDGDEGSLREQLREQLQRFELGCVLREQQHRPRVRDRVVAHVAAAHLRTDDEREQARGRGA